MRTSINPLLLQTDQLSKYDRIDARFVQTSKHHRDLGIHCQSDEAGAIFVTKCTKGKTAEVSGKVREGDIISLVNGEDAKKLGIHGIRSALKNSAVTLVILRQKVSGAAPRKHGRLSLYVEHHTEAKLKELFCLLDADDSGHLDKNEIEVLFTLLHCEGDEASALLRQHLATANDADGLSWEEVAALHSKLKLDDKINKSSVVRGAVTRIQTIRSAFNKCDVDHSGGLSGPDIQSVMNRLGVKVTREDCDVLVQNIDALGDGDGEVSWSEFLMALTSKDFKENLSPVFARFTINNLAQLPSLLDSDRVLPKEEQKKIMNSMAFMERIGVNYLQSMQRIDISHGEEDTNYGRTFWLTKTDRAYLNRCTRNAVFWAAMAGVLSALFGAAAEGAYEELTWTKRNLTDPWKPHPDLMEIPSLQWGMVLVGVTIVIASIIEILLVYRITFVTALNITQITGLVLDPPDAHRVWVASSLVRTALEMGNPTEVTWGIDPMRKANKFKVLLGFLLYKAKRGVSAFIFKLLIKRVFVRSATKSMLAFAAAPVNAAWNALTMYKVLWEAKLVALGPAAACEVLNEMFLEHDVLSGKLCMQLMRAVAMVIIMKQNVHPNLHIMEEFIIDLVADKLPPHPKFISLDELRENFEAQWETEKDHHAEVQETRKTKLLNAREKEFWKYYGMDDEQLFLKELGVMSVMDKQLCVAVVVLGLVMAGKTNRQEKNLYMKVAVDTAGLPDRWPEVVRLSRNFIAGENWDIEDLIMITSTNPNDHMRDLTVTEHADAWFQSCLRICAI